MPENSVAFAGEQRHPFELTAIAVGDEEMKMKSQGDKADDHGKKTAPLTSRKAEHDATPATIELAPSPAPAQSVGKSKSKPVPKPKPRGSRPDDSRAPGGSKKAAAIALLRRAGGATLKELMKATGWQAHSVRGFISGILKKQMGMKVKSSKTADGERTYQQSFK